MFYQKLKLSLLDIALPSISTGGTGKRIGKATTQQMNKTGDLTTYLIEIFKNHNNKNFQKEN